MNLTSGRESLHNMQSPSSDFSGFARDVDRAMKDMEERMYRFVNERIG